MPQQEIRQPLLATGADDQVRIWLARGVQMPGDVVRSDGLGDVGEGSPLFSPLVQERTERVDDLLPAAVPHRQGDVPGPYRSLGSLRLLP